MSTLVNETLSSTRVLLVRHVLEVLKPLPDPHFVNPHGTDILMAEIPRGSLDIKIIPDARVSR